MPAADNSMEDQTLSWPDRALTPEWRVRQRGGPRYKDRTVVRYVVTYIEESTGLRRVLKQQGRLTYTTAEEARKAKAAILENNPAKLLHEVYGREPLFAVRPVLCWLGHFDPVSLYVE